MLVKCNAYQSQLRALYWFKEAFSDLGYLFTRGRFPPEFVCVINCAHLQESFTGIYFVIICRKNENMGYGALHQTET